MAEKRAKGKARSQKTIRRGKTKIWEGVTGKGFLKEITNFVEEAGHALDLDEEDLFRIQMAVGEAGANSWEHSYRGKTGRLRLEVERKLGVIEIRLTDWGTPFRVREVPVPHISGNLTELNLDGLGLLVMQRAMDEVQFSSHPKRGNTVIMRRRLASPKKAKEGANSRGSA